MNPATFLDASARRCPDAVLVIYDGKSYTYGQIHGWANQVAHGLWAAGFRKGDKIALWCPNRPGFIVAYYGILKLGAVAVVLSTGLKKRDLVQQLRDADVQALFSFDSSWDSGMAEIGIEAASEVESCRRHWIIPRDVSARSSFLDVPSLCDLIKGQSAEFETAAVAGDDTAIIPYTSGTLGRPKGVEITHGNIASMTLINVALADVRAGQVRLVANPLFHIMGQVSGLNVPVLCGQTLVLMEKFDPRLAWHLIADEGVSYVAGSPLMFKLLLDHAKHADEMRVRKTLRLCGTGAAPLPSAWSDEFEARFGTPLLPGYGATETTSVVSWNCPSDRVKAGSVGRPIPGVQVRIAGERDVPLSAGERGEIVVRGPGIMKGYLNRREATRTALAGGWYRTGDVGFLDDEGYLHWTGRTDDVIVRWTGTNVSPAEIENALLSHPDIVQAAVVGTGDPAAGRRVVALVVPKPDQGVDEQSVRRWLSYQLSDNLMPDDVQFRDSLPTTETGKIAKHLVR